MSVGSVDAGDDAAYALARPPPHGPEILFVACFCIILSIYGSDFATVPAYLADMFGMQFVGAIHGRLLTSWSTASSIGALVVNYIREGQVTAGVPRAQLMARTPRPRDTCA